LVAAVGERLATMPAAVSANRRCARCTTARPPSGSGLAVKMVGNRECGEDVLRRPSAAAGLQLARQNTEPAAQLRAQPDIRYVFVPHDDSATPTMLVTLDPKHGMLTLKRVGGFPQAPEMKQRPSWRPLLHARGAAVAQRRRWWWPPKPKPRPSEMPIGG
jgi:hypothetical protein